MLPLPISFALGIVLMTPSVAAAETWVMPDWGAAEVQARAPMPEVWSIDVDGIEGPWRMFKSFRAFQQADVPAGTGVVYDNEPFGHTPMPELRHPKRYMRAFVRLAHARGLVAMLAPARSIGKYAACRWERFDKCGFTETQADYFLLQVQRLECDPRAFEREIRRARSGLRSTLIVELTVAWPHPCVTVDKIVRAYDIAARHTDHLALWSSPEPHYRPWDEQVGMMLEVLARATA